MRVDLTPSQLDLAPGIPMPVILTVTNTESIIAGFGIRVLGADPGWIELPTEHLSLFPDETRVVEITVNPPKGMPAGNRRLAVQVRELTEPYSSTISEIDLAVPKAPMTQLRVDPMVVTAGKRANFSILVENTGNTELAGYLVGDDPEGEVRFEFEPPRIDLLPGQHAVVDLRASAKRPFFGTPTVRSLGLFLDDKPPGRPVPVAESDSFADLGADGDGEADEEKPPLAAATFIQKSVMARGALSLIGLLFAVTVFAIIITLALSRLVAQSAADRNLALQVAAAKDATNASSGTSGVSGTVRQLTSRKGAPGVAVSVYDESDTTEAVATTATDPNGLYTINGLAAGSYKISFRGAGFVQLWYPGSLTVDDATAVALDAGQVKSNVDVSLGGVPATVSGTVTGDDVSASTLFLTTVPAATATSTTAPNSTRAAPVTPPANPGTGGTGGGAGTVGPPAGSGAVVQQVPIGSDGTFSLSNVPSPSTYELIVVKAGYANASQRVDVGAGDARKGVTLRLVKGDGLIVGAVTDGRQRLGGVTITATSGTSSASTVSLSTGSVGTFSLRTLATPAAYTIVANKAGYASQTISVSLAAAQQLTGVSITLARSSASLSGTVAVSGEAAGGPGGVSVTFTDGRSTVQTVTSSDQDTAGQWSIAGLPVPGIYTATFSRSDLQSQTVSVALDAAGRSTNGSVGARVDENGKLSITMTSATAIVAGSVRQPGAQRQCAGSSRVGEATVSLSNGTATYSVITASVGGKKACGFYRLERIPPGTYTLTARSRSGTSPKSEVITLAAGDVLDNENIALPSPASLSGTVTCSTPGATTCSTPQKRPGWTVFLYKRDDYPTTVYQRTITDKDGVYNFDDIDAGNYVVAVGPTNDPGNTVATTNVAVRPSDSATSDVTVTQ